MISYQAPVIRFLCITLMFLWSIIFWTYRWGSYTSMKLNNLLKTQKEQNQDSNFYLLFSKTVLFSWYFETITFYFLFSMFSSLQWNWLLSFFSVTHNAWWDQFNFRSCSKESLIHLADTRLCAEGTQEPLSLTGRNTGKQLMGWW